MSALKLRVVSLSTAVTVAVVESVVFLTKSPTLTVDVKFCVPSTSLSVVVAVVVPESFILENVTVSPSNKSSVSVITTYCIF